MVKVGFIGFGKMGQSIAKLLKDKAEIRFVVDPSDTDAANACSSDACFEKSLNKLPLSVVDETDVVIEFTTPEYARQNILNFMQKKRDAKIISGTTGWNIREIETKINEHNATVLYSSNYSIGVNLVWNVLENVSKKLSGIKDFDASIVEYHHKAKKDSPSGTAKTMQEVMACNGVTAPITAVRSGHFPGTHIVSFDSLFETVEIKHEARNRDVFSLGVINSIDWIVKQKKSGLFYFKDILEA